MHAPVKPVHDVRVGYLLWTITQPNAASPMITATTIAQVLTRMALTVCLALSFAAISRLRSLLSPVGSVTALLQRQLILI